MSLQQLDAFFPFFVLTYGAMITFVLNSKFLMKLADEKLPANMVSQMNGHRILALVSLVVGALWSLQSLWV